MIRRNSDYIKFMLPFEPLFYQPEGIIFEIFTSKIEFYNDLVSRVSDFVL